MVVSGATRVKETSARLARGVVTKGCGTPVGQTREMAEKLDRHLEMKVRGEYACKQTAKKGNSLLALVGVGWARAAKLGDEFEIDFVAVLLDKCHNHKGGGKTVRPVEVVARVGGRGAPETARRETGT